MKYVVMNCGCKSAVVQHIPLAETTGPLDHWMRSQGWSVGSQEPCSKLSVSGEVVCNSFLWFLNLIGLLVSWISPHGISEIAFRNNSNGSCSVLITLSNGKCQARLLKKKKKTDFYCRAPNVLLQNLSKVNSLKIPAFLGVFFKPGRTSSLILLIM